MLLQRGCQIRCYTASEGGISHDETNLPYPFIRKRRAECRV